MGRVRGPRDRSRAGEGRGCAAACSRLPSESSSIAQAVYLSLNVPIYCSSSLSIAERALLGIRRPLDRPHAGAGLRCAGARSRLHAGSSPARDRQRQEVTSLPEKKIHEQ